MNLYKTKGSIQKFGFATNYAVQNEHQAKKATSRSSALYDVTNGFVVDFVMKRYKDSELTIAMKQLDAIQLLNGHPAIYLADRYYNSVELFCALEQHGLKYCVRGKTNFFKHYIKKMTSDDEWIRVKIDKVWQKRLKYDHSKDRFSKEPYIDIRVVKRRFDVRHNNKTRSVETIYFTNLDQDEFDAKDIALLYRKRWEIETTYKTLKTELEWERYFSRDCDSETCAIYAKVVFHNLLGILRKEMDQELVNADKESNKYRYQINVKQLNDRIRDEKILRWIRNGNPRKIEQMVSLIQEQIHKLKVPVRPDRHYKRWNRIVSQGKPMRFRLDGRNWPNTVIQNGVLITCPTK